MSHEDRVKVLGQWANVLVGIALLAAVFMVIGKRDYQADTLMDSVRELRNATRDLAITASVNTSRIEEHRRAIDAVQARIESLEREAFLENGQ